MLLVLDGGGFLKVLHALTLYIVVFWEWQQCIRGLQWFDGGSDLYEVAFRWEGWGFGCEIKGEGVNSYVSIGVICSFQDRPQYDATTFNKESIATPKGMLKDGIIYAINFQKVQI